VDFELTPEQAAIRAVAREFADAELGDKIAPFDAASTFPREIVARLGPLGFLGVLVPEEYGGSGLDYVSYALIVEELNRGDASVGITMWAHNSLGTNHINLFGSAAQKREWLPRLARGEILGAWGLTEPGSGSDAAALRTRAESRDERLGAERQQGVHHQRLGGRRRGGHGAHRSREEVQGHLRLRGAARARPGFSAGKPYRKLGLHASDTAELIFEDVRVPAGRSSGERGHGLRAGHAGPGRRADRHGRHGRRHRARPPSTRRRST
jgi:alkylation response protein AidB-like acyl-CoA dehydrogenase